jgi:hypothetical protein
LSRATSIARLSPSTLDQPRGTLKKGSLSFIPVDPVLDSSEGCGTFESGELRRAIASRPIGDALAAANGEGLS